NSRPPGAESGGILSEQQRTRGGGGFLRKPENGAALARQGGRECPCQIGDSSHHGRRYRRARPRRLQASEFRGPAVGCVGGSRAEANARGARLCATRAGGAVCLYPRESEYRTAPGGA